MEHAMTQLSEAERRRLLQTFAGNLATYRKALGLSQEKFGEWIGITRQTVSSIERGAYPLTWPILLSALLVCAGNLQARKAVFASFADDAVCAQYLRSCLPKQKMADANVFSGKTLHGQNLMEWLQDAPCGLAIFVCKETPSRGHLPELLSANERFREMIGVSGEQFRKDLLERLPDKEEIETTTLCLPGEKGEPTWLSCAVKRTNVEGQSYLSLLLFDVTEYKLGQELALERLREYRELEALSDELRFRYDPESDRLLLPPPLAGLADEDDGTLYGAFRKGRLRGTLHEEDYEPFAGLVQTVQKSGEPREGEYRMRMQGAEFCWCRISVVPMRDETGRIVQLAGKITIIDEERKMRDEHISDRMLINRLYSTDRLTGLYTETAFAARVREMQKDPGAQKVHALIYVDINHFSYINETYGYRVGDRVLREFAGLFLRHGKMKFACRIHSDYFVIYRNAKTQEKILREAAAFGVQLSKELKKQTPEVEVQLTAGLCFLRRGELDVANAIGQANLARRYAKEHRLSLFVCTEELLWRRKEEGNLAARLPSALAGREIEVFLQPKISMQSGEIIGAEALARWRGASGYRSPAEFIPVLERTGHIAELDYYVYTSVLAMLRRWQRERRQMVPISVNFSKSHRSYDGFTERILRLAEQYDVNPSYLQLELPEELLRQDDIANDVRRLKENGFGVAIDDFGLGYSSLALLLDTPADTVKIGRVFLQNVKQSEIELNYVRSMSDMIAATGKDVVFEGVETEEQAEFLRRCGFDQVQGFLFERPLPRTEFEEKYVTKS